MSASVPDIPRIYQKPGRIDAQSLEACNQLLLILPARPGAALFKALPEGKKIHHALQTTAADSTPALMTRLANKKQTLVVGGTLKQDATAFEQLTLGRKLVAALANEKAGSVGIAAVGFDNKEQVTILNNVLAAVLAAALVLPSFKSKELPPNVKSIRLIGIKSRIDTARTEAEAAGNNLARWLTAMPPNKMDAVHYADFTRDLAKSCNWSYQRLGSKALKKLGAGAFLAVAQGNDDDSASIVRLRYRAGKKNARPDLSLIGKGIIFDTGGTNLKPFNSMLDMHGDMQGSAVALGILLAISKLELPLSVDCWLALTENRTGPNAYKSRDIVTAANGKTIQTIHTDAEGRMALADTLVLASREKPGIMFDYATLTGTCVSAITTRYSGVFTNRPDLHPRLKKTGVRSGERVWPFPIGDEFLEELKCHSADIRQCSPSGAGDHILAASFLSEFIENETPWVHMDLSASDNDDGLGHIASKFTGFGVRYTMSAILDDNLFKANV